MFSVQRLIPAAKPLALLLGLAGPAGAESATVQGTGDLDKMSVNNGPGAVVAKVYGPNIECGLSRWVEIVMRDGDGTKYTAMGGCYPGDPTAEGGWHTSLSRGSKLVTCDGYTLTYNSTGFWRFEVPRSCLNRLANRIKVKSDLASGSPSPGETVFTRWLIRG
jgi:hypothetical protein